MPLRLEERRLLLISFDLLMILVAVVVSMYFWSVRGRLDFDLDFLAEQSRWFLIFAALWIGASTLTGFYDVRLASDISAVWSSTFLTSLLVLVGYAFIYYAIPPNTIPRNIAFLPDGDDLPPDRRVPHGLPAVNGA